MKTRVENSELNAPKKRMADHLVTLRKYAARVIGQDEILTPWEDADRIARLEDYFEVGISFDCTHRELANVLLKGLVDTPV